MKRKRTKANNDFVIGDLIKNKRFPGLYLVIGDYHDYLWDVLCPDSQIGNVGKDDPAWEKCSLVQETL